MEKLGAMEMATVKQGVEWLEVFSGFEGKNRYFIDDFHDNHIYFAAEKSSFMARLFLQFLRPLELHVMDLDGSGVFKIVKPFRFFFHEGIVRDSNNRYYGRIKRKLSIFKKELVVEDQYGNEVYKIESEILHPWTLKVYKSGLEVGEILKKWSGIARETFTDADDFTIKFPSNASVEEKVLLLGAVFLVDLIYFENKD